MRKVTATDAKARFSELVRSAQFGNTVVITHHGRDVARLVSVDRRLVVDAALVANYLMEGMMQELEEGWIPEYEAVVAVEELNRHGGLVPPIWHSDVCNALLETEKQGSLREDWMAECLAALKTIPVLTDQEADLERAMYLARTHDLSFSTASYLELATRRQLPLATTNEDLDSAARAEGVDVFNAYKPWGS